MNPVPLFLIIVTLPLLLGGVSNDKMKSEEHGKDRWFVMWLPISYFVGYCFYIAGYITFWQNSPFISAETLLFVMIGIIFVFPFLGLCHLFYLMYLFFGGNKQKVKPHFVSVLCSLVLAILSYTTMFLGYYPSV